MGLALSIPYLFLAQCIKTFKQDYCLSNWTNFYMWFLSLIYRNTWLVWMNSVQKCVQVLLNRAIRKLRKKSHKLELLIKNFWRELTCLPTDFHELEINGRIITTLLSAPKNGKLLFFLSFCCETKILAGKSPLLKFLLFG